MVSAAARRENFGEEGRSFAIGRARERRASGAGEGIARTLFFFSASFASFEGRLKGPFMNGTPVMVAAVAMVGEPQLPDR